ncbi:MlaC/ttg2D family ABC transporter substrate-binding protein [Thiomicrospira cyclica]|jgi:phospholipid transport system substrate-binding protein|uniref:Toluene tolerance family protein n=1 Tax=Thiomicrospira cyclica (strain DSM 14477 / JCM 11371 / ALM1) TaxID=717773 RepID=F6DBD7_THICA|nr:ABC transporter substrate-binding protein [Thiomicrospira cyclica]AEG31245.1 toluene tolerance family protein [Thiomicrospira cyclica ALM1]
MKWITGLATALLLTVGVAKANTIDQSDPQVMIQGMSGLVLNELKARAEELAQDPKALKAFADEALLPYVDTMRMARFVVGRDWRAATPQQQQDFVEQFTLSVIQQYSNSLMRFNVESVEIGGAIPDGQDRVIVQTRVKQSNGNNFDIAYRVHKEASSGNWMIYDVLAENISLLLSLRQTYATDIERRGLQAVIDGMKDRNVGFN